MDFEALATLWLNDPAIPAAPVLTLALQRAWPQAAGHLLLAYRSPTGDLYPGQWHPDPQFLSDQANALKQTPQAGALWARSGNGDRVLLQPHGLDGRMTGLAPRLQDRSNALISHRPGKRAVVRSNSGAEVCYWKFFATRKSFSKACQAADLLNGMAIDFATPQVLQSDAQEKSLCFSALAGQSLHQICQQPTADVTQARRLGRALADLHDPGRVGHGDSLMPHAESAVLANWLEKLVAFFPDLAQQIAPMIDQQRKRDALYQVREPSIIHRDFHDKQIFHTDQAVAIIDFDTLALGDPYIDLANLLVHLELRCLQQRASTTFIRRYGQHLLQSYSDAIDHPRLLHALDATRLRLVCVYAFRPPWQSLLTALHARVGHAFADGL